MKKRLAALLLCLALLPLTGCSDNWDEGVQDDAFQTLMEYYKPVDDSSDKVSPLTSFALPYFDGQTLDPITCPDGPHQVLDALLYEGLFALDTHFVPQPQLAKRYTYDAQAHVYTIQLHQDIRFSDGSPLTGEDVAATLKRAQDSDRYGARLHDVSYIYGYGHTVEIGLKRDNTAFCALLDIPIVKAGTQDDVAPIGTGPYVPDKKDGKPYLHINKNWWQTTDKLPLQQINLVRCKDSDTMTYAFYAREIQLLVYDLTAGASSVYGTGNYTDAPTTSMHYIGINTTREPLNNPRLRQALSLGIDRSGCISAYLLGHGKSAQFPLSPASKLYPEEQDIPYSPDNFDTAMKKAGFDKGNYVPLTLVVNAENSFKVDAAKKIAADLSHHDLHITVEVLPWDDYLAALRGGRFDLYYGECRLSADWNLRPLLSRGGNMNYGGYSSEKTSQLIDKALAAPESKRHTAVDALCKQLATDAPILPIGFKSVSVLVPTGAVDAITPTAANPFYNFSDWKIHLQSK